MFNVNGKEKQLVEALNIKVENVDEFLKRMSGFLNGRKVISKRNISDSLFILHEIQKREKEIEAKRLKTLTKNPLLLKYEKKILELYKYEKLGYVRISKYLLINHSVKISKSTIARFLKDSEVIPYGKS